MVQDFVTLPSRTELFYDRFSFLATEIRLNVYLVQGFFPEGFSFEYSALGFGLLLRKELHTMDLLLCCHDGTKHLDEFPFCLSTFLWLP